MLGNIIINSLKRLKHNLPFLLSGLMLAVLFAQPSKVILVVCLAVGALIFAISVCKNNTAYMGKDKSTKSKIFYILSIAIVAAGGYSFYKSWGSAGIVLSFSEKLNISPNIFVPLIAVAFGILSFYAVYNLLFIVFNEINYVFGETITYDKSKLINNIKKNFLFFISSVAFLCLNMVNSLTGVVATVLAVVVIFVILSQVGNLFAKVKNVKLTYKLIATITSVGICVYLMKKTLEILMSSNMFAEKCLELGIDRGIIFTVIVAIFSVISFLSVFCVISLLYNYLGKKLKGVFSGISKAEYIIYGLIIALFFGFTTYAFLNSQVFYRTDHLCDIIYTSDSQMLVKDNVYMNLIHSENDIRQPLFAVFAAPFVGFGYAISLMFPFISCSTELFMNFIQIIMIFMANFILAKLLRLSAYERVGFMILSSFTYTTLLFTLMMEQYIVAYFWVIFFVYLYCEEKKADNLAVVAAGGTLLTSLILTPFVSESFSVKNLNVNKAKSFIRDVERSAIVFALFFISFARLSITNNISTLMSFTGKCVSIPARVLQYLSFISDCFIKPDAQLNLTKVEYPSWQLNDATTVNIVGVIILLLAVLGFVTTRKNLLSQMSMCWVAFSFLVLVIIGWGSSENGMILYALYFGWAFLVLIYQLILSIAKKLNIKAITIIFSTVVTVALAVINIFAIKDLLQFAISYYPV